MFLKMLGDVRRLLRSAWPEEANWSEVRNALVVVVQRLRAMATATKFTEADDGLVSNVEGQLEEWGIDIPDADGEPRHLLVELAGFLAGVSYLLDELWPGNAVSDLIGRVGLELQSYFDRQASA